MNYKYKMNDTIEVNELDNELVIIIPQSEKMYYCNKLSKDIVYYIRDGITVQQINDFLLEKYDVDSETLESDINEALDKLAQFQIIILEE